MKHETLNLELFPPESPCHADSGPRIKAIYLTKNV